MTITGDIDIVLWTTIKDITNIIVVIAGEFSFISKEWKYIGLSWTKHKTIFSQSTTTI